MDLKQVETPEVAASGVSLVLFVACFSFFRALIITQSQKKTRFVTSANWNIAKPAMNTYKSAMNRQDQEIKTGGKAASAIAHAAGAAYRWSKGKMGF